jgi:hypothetical protein
MKRFVGILAASGAARRVSGKVGFSPVQINSAHEHGVSPGDQSGVLAESVKMLAG